MPLKPKYAKMREAMRKKYGKEKGDKVFWAYCNKNDVNPDQKAYVFVSEELKANGEELEGYISTGDKDLVNDVVTPNCMMDMLNQLQDRSIKLDVEHESFRGRQEEKELNKTLIPVGKIIDASLDRKGIKVKCELNKHHSRFEEVKNSIKDKFLDAFSIAYVPTKFSHKAKEGETTRLLEKVNLLNVAFTGNPVNPYASFTNVALKSLEDGVEFSEDISESEINELIGGIDMAEKEEKKDEEQPQEKPEEKPEQPTEETKPEEAPKEEPKQEEKPAEANVEAKALSDKISALSERIAELKSVYEKDKEESEAKEQLKALTEKVEELDKVLSKPQFKARVEQLDEARAATVEEKSKAKGPLDQI